jgi:hypothetical protein
VLKGRVAELRSATRPFEKSAFEAKITPWISRCPCETAAFSGFCKPEKPAARFLLQPVFYFAARLFVLTSCKLYQRGLATPM